MEGLGEYLKHGRKEAGLSLEDLAGRTRIRLENLERLEDGDLAALPTETYVRGFVRLVCKELGLPADEGIERYEMLLRSRAPTDEMVWSAEQETRETTRLEEALRDPERVVGIAKRAGIAAAAIVAVVLVITGGRFVAGLVSDRGGGETVRSDAPAETADAGAPEVAAGSGEGAVPEDAPAAVESEPAPEVVQAEETPAPPPVQTPPEPEPEPEPLQLALAEVGVPPGEPGIRPGSAPRDPAGETDLAQAAEDTAPEDTAPQEIVEEEPAAASPVVERERPRDPDPDPAPAQQDRAETPAPPVVKPDPAPEPPEEAVAETPREIIGTRSTAARLELEVEALRDVEFSVLLDGVGRPRTKSMQAGDRRTWKAQNLFVITADDGGAIRLRLSGRDLGLAGADGEPIRGLRVRAP